MATRRAVRAPTEPNEGTSARAIRNPIAPVPASIPAEQIKLLRERSNVSQPVFARYLNTSASTVKQWESGEKHPSGMALKLLSIVQKHGLEILA